MNRDLQTLRSLRVDGGAADLASVFKDKTPGLLVADESEVSTDATPPVLPTTTIKDTDPVDLATSSDEEELPVRYKRRKPRQSFEAYLEDKVRAAREERCVEKGWSVASRRLPLNFLGTDREVMQLLVKLTKAELITICIRGFLLQPGDLDHKKLKTFLRRMRAKRGILKRVKESVAASPSSPVALPVRIQDEEPIVRSVRPKPSIAFEVWLERHEQKAAAEEPTTGEEEYPRCMRVSLPYRFVGTNHQVMTVLRKLSVEDLCIVCARGYLLHKGDLFNKGLKTFLRVLRAERGIPKLVKAARFDYRIPDKPTVAGPEEWAPSMGTNARPPLAARLMAQRALLSSRPSAPAPVVEPVAASVAVAAPVHDDEDQPRHFNRRKPSITFEAWMAKKAEQLLVAVEEKQWAKAPVQLPHDFRGTDREVMGVLNRMSTENLQVVFARGYLLRMGDLDHKELKTFLRALRTMHGIPKPVKVKRFDYRIPDTPTAVVLCVA